MPKDRHLACCILNLALVWTVAGCVARHRVAVPSQDPAAAQFQAYCAACHLPPGPGMPAEAPPLGGSPWVTGPADRLIKIVVQGLRGPLEIAGKTYDQEMPAVAQGLTDDQVAALVSYVRRRFGAAAGPVPPAAVSNVRAATRGRSGYWTAAELLREP